MRDENKPALILVGFLVVCIIGAYQSSQRISTEVSTYYEIYNARLPFGVFLSSGGGSFILGTGGFSINTDEVYLIKYFDGEELKSLELDAEKTSIIVDETFRLEEITLNVDQNELWWHRKYVGTLVRERRLHIPYLPDIDQTLTEDWDT